MPKLVRQGRNGTSYDEAAQVAGDYLANLMADSDEAEADVSEEAELEFASE